MAAGKGQAVFHSGALFIYGADGTPVRGPTISEISLDAKASLKELQGENAFAEAIGRGSIKISGKFKVNRTNQRFSNAAFFNQTLNTGADQGREMVLDEAKTAAASKFTVAAGVAFAEDLGLVNATTGETYTYVAAAPAAKQYTYNATTGEYTVSATDATASFLVNYMKKVAGQVLSINNTLAGEAPTFKLIAVNKFQGQTKTIWLPACVSEGFSEAWKSEDFSGQDYSFSVQEHATLGVGRIYTTYQS
jgi:hypothetical protein